MVLSLVPAIFFILRFYRFRDLSRKINFWIIANFSYSRAWTTDMYISKDAEFYKEAKYIEQNLFWFRFRDSSRKNKILYCVE